MRADSSLCRLFAVGTRIPRLSFGVVERSKIESFLVQIQFVLVLIVVFGLFHRLIAVTYAAIRETGQSQVNKIVFINNFV